VGCESFITEKEIVDGKCPIHKTHLILTKETNKFFDLSKFSNLIKDVLVDKNKSVELKNIIQEKFDLSITRQNVNWGIDTGDGDVFYVWFEALLNYIFAIKYYEDKEYFNKFWDNSLIICGKDNLKFQAYILQAFLLSNDIPQTKEVLVHGNILDADGNKLSKTSGNVIDPIEQVKKYGLDAVRYYLIFGLNTLSDSKYSETELIQKWNNDIVNGLGNLISRLLHLVESKNVSLDEKYLSVGSNDRIQNNTNEIKKYFSEYNFKELGNLLNGIVFNLNKRITIERPFDKNCNNYSEILNELYFELKAIIPYYAIIIKGHKELLERAFNYNKKVILFERI
jgi:methionyl-tRNA synthetase